MVFKAQYSAETRRAAVEMFMELLETDSNIARCARAVKEKYGVSAPRLREWAHEDGHDLGATRLGAQQLQAENSALRARVTQLQAENVRLQAQVDTLREVVGLSTGGQ